MSVHQRDDRARFVGRHAGGRLVEQYQARARCKDDRDLEQSLVAVALKCLTASTELL